MIRYTLPLVVLCAFSVNAVAAHRGQEVDSLQDEYTDGGNDGVDVVAGTIRYSF